MVFDNQAAIQQAKTVVRDYQAEFDLASIDNLGAVLSSHTGTSFHWRGMHPFHDLFGAARVAAEFWQPLRHSFTAMQRRQDIFMAGISDESSSGDREDSVWVCSMGHFVGLFDNHWIGIPATGKMVFIRYAEFYCVKGGCIIESALFMDILSVMKQAGCYPLPPETGVSFMYPGPRTHDGLLFDQQEPGESTKTLELINRMIADLNVLNTTGNDQCPPELLAQTWREDMTWYGPTGIGASYTIKRYQQQHQYPFRLGLKDKVFNGHVCRISEGHYGGFFGWPNLTNTAKGGFLGLPANEVRADMRVVDVYRRDGDKLAENWIFMDIPHYLNMQGLDVLGRLRQLNSTVTTD